MFKLTIICIIFFMFFGIVSKIDTMIQLQKENNLLLGTQNCYMLNDDSIAFWECVNDKQD